MGTASNLMLQEIVIKIYISLLATGKLNLPFILPVPLFRLHILTRPVQPITIISEHHITEHRLRLTSPDRNPSLTHPNKPKPEAPGRDNTAKNGDREKEAAVTDPVMVAAVPAAIAGAEVLGFWVSGGDFGTCSGK